MSDDKRTTIWCEYCRNHPDSIAPPTASAFVNLRLSGQGTRKEGVFQTSPEGLVHVHDLIIVAWGSREAKVLVWLWRLTKPGWRKKVRRAAATRRHHM